jgi:hypothetical protein
MLPSGARGTTERHLVAAERARGAERPVRVPAGGEHLFGVLTTPDGGGGGPLVVAHPGGFWIPAHHRNRQLEG